MDIADRAQVYEEGERETAILTTIRKMCAPQLIIDGVIHCLDCHMPIEDNRLQALPNAARCVDCQSIHERRAV